MTSPHQKKILALHDLSGFGRSSLVPIISTLSVMGHQCVPLPTAVFSTHTAIAGYVVRDLTEDLLPSIEQYAQLSLQFDAIYSGFVGSERQIHCITQSIHRLGRSDGLVLVDPVMGDNGSIYETYTAKMCSGMQELCALADIITPNLTEAAILLGYAPTDVPHSPAETAQWARTLEQRYQAKVVLTGVNGGSDTVGVLCCEQGQLAFFEHARIAEYYPGTGDLFASVLLGDLLRGTALPDACKTAAYFVRDCIRHTAALQTDHMHGVQFESLLGNLLPHGAIDQTTS